MFDDEDEEYIPEKDEQIEQIRFEPEPDHKQTSKNQQQDAMTLTLSILDMADKYSSAQENKSFQLNPKRLMIMRWLKENRMMGQ